MTLVAQELVTCPCGQTVYWTEDEHGNPGLVHKLPVCHLFDSLEPDVYLQHVRRGLGIPDPPGEEPS